MSAFATWLMGFARTFLTWLYNVGIDTINAFIKALCGFIWTLASLFPSNISTPSPGDVPVTAVTSVFIQTLNWLFPMSYLLTIVGFIVLGYSSYFFCAVVLRWFKVLT